MAFQVISKNYLKNLMAQQLLYLLKFHLLPAAVFSNNLDFYLKYAKLLSLAISALRLVASSLE